MHHSETPWTVGLPKPDGTIAVIDPNGLPVCYVQARPHFDDSQPVNARLIAEAPKMLKQIKEAAATCEYCGGTTKESDTGRDCFHCLDWRQSIAKIEGA